jgi:NAD(P)-dependent dehydrogenase (short-subunit alcohol dehydrogenase family)
MGPHPDHSPLDAPHARSHNPVMDRTLLIVGVRQLGRTIALHFAAKGWRVICAARTEADVHSLARDVTAAGGSGVPFVCDLTRPETLADIPRFRPDLCIAAQTAGGRFGSKPLLDIDGEELDRSYSSMMRGTWNLLKIVGADFTSRRSGTFLQAGTSSGVRTKEGFAVLGATQHGLRALVQVAAREWRPLGVHVAYLAIDGPIESEAMRTRGVDPSIMLDPREIARACEYLHEQHQRSWTHELLLRPSGGDWTAPV